MDPLPWEDDGKESEAVRLRRRVLEILGGGNPLRDATHSRRKMKRPRKALNLEDQFDIGDGPRESKWWSFWKDGINNSGIGLWLTCRHQFWLRYVCGYEMSVYNDSIEFGNIFHWLIERWLRGKLKNPEAELRGKYHRQWSKGIGATLTPQNKQTQEVFYALAAAMWPTYAVKYANDLKTKNFGIEVQFEVKHCLKPGVFVPLYGTIDRLWRDGRRRMADHKTTSWINEFEIEASLPLNFQLMFYAYADYLRTGKVVETVSHDTIRRPKHRQGQKESIEKFARRVGSEVKKNPDYYFLRNTTDAGLEKIQRFRDTVLHPILCDMAEWACGRGPHYPNLNSLIGRYGPCKLFTPITTSNFTGLPRKRPTTRGIER